MRLARFAVMTVLASCGGTFAVGPNSATGTYNLVRVDGLPVPAQGATGFVVRGRLELKSDTHYALTQTDSVPGIATALSVSGRWSVQDNGLQLVQDSNTFQLGILLGADSIRVGYESHQNLYVKQ